MANKIIEFWRNNANGMFDNIDILKKEIQDAFLEEFLENKTHWDNVLGEFNNDINRHIKTFGINSNKMLTYDEFVKLILGGLKKWIDENGNIFEEDTPDIIQLIKQDVIELFLNDVEFTDIKTDDVKTYIKDKKFNYNNFKAILFL